MQTRSLINLTLIAAAVLMFSNTLGSVITLAQTLDRVTAEKLSQVALRNTPEDLY